MQMILAYKYRKSILGTRDNDKIQNETTYLQIVEQIQNKLLLPDIIEPCASNQGFILNANLYNYR